MTLDNRDHFCVGFLFSKDGWHVALVEKKRPSWQAGKYNGIGGGVEKGENALQAQIREFKEETSLDFNEWERIGVMKCPSCDVEIFRGFLEKDYNDRENLPSLKPEKRNDGKELEVPRWIGMWEIAECRTDFLHNVPWLIDFCLDTRGLNQDISINYRSDSN